MCSFAETVLLEDIKNDLFLLLDSSSTRVSCRKAVRLVAHKTGGGNRQAALIINRLVTDGFFRYVYDFGQSYLEKNYTGVVRLSDRVMLAPPGLDVAIPKGMVIIRNNPGAAFGDCRHPTTRLSVRAIDFVLAERPVITEEKTALDIGTGSGILAITAAALGMSRVLATDIDPCARKEARENIMENRLEDKIAVSDQPLETIAGRFALITGNLRPPTLISYAKRISEKVAQNGAVVLSGVKEEEYDTLISAYTKAFDCIWKQAEGGWCATVLQKREKKNGD